ncbi:zinc finger protein 616-like [Gigantopelta aegis]|uniref:zinc finger protein 616-like n=1 Tax=Gigantopelta aegis TaxID=1735272 RepID=UPI001B88AEDF|nr:zinc finger protein 616-like [Gigantopelta aegis]XP_041366288.1 zinc finger protein 616-like [Gigantopelta aegis]XP_041366289.1 zinc finger protein 616-like [Gigantopelta aegis]
MSDDANKPGIKDEMFVKTHQTPKPDVIHVHVAVSKKVHNISMQSSKLEESNVEDETESNVNNRGVVEKTSDSVTHLQSKSYAEAVIVKSVQAVSSCHDSKRPDSTQEQKSECSSKKSYCCQCNECHKKFESYALFHLHKQTHMGQLVCKVCFKSYPTSEDLLVHRKFHVHEKKCSICGKQFRTMNKLKIHNRVHTGEKPFSCRCCGKRFSDQSNRNRHYRFAHTEERALVEKQYLDEFSSQVKSSGMFAYKFI